MKLHIGGEEAKEGWKILNIMAGLNVDYLGDLCDMSQFENDSIEAIYASHVLEHVSIAQALPALKGLHRVLQPDGQLMISVPDLDVLCQAMLDPALNAEKKLHVMRMMFGGQTSDHDFHHFGWNWLFMHNFLRLAGFSRIEKVDNFHLFDDTSEYQAYGYRISLNVIATK